MRLPDLSALRSHRLPAILTAAVAALTSVTIGCGAHPLGTSRQTPISVRSAGISKLNVVPGAPGTVIVNQPASATVSPVPSPVATETAAAPLAESPAQSPVPVEVQAVPPAEANATAAPETDSEHDQLPPHAVPVRVLIPRIGVNARVIPVGEAPDGSMDSPNNPVDVGWWDLGSRPGDQGSTVLGGHVDYAGYGAAVFWNLNLLRAGDQITVVSANDSRWLFTVTEVAIYSYSDTSVLDRIFRTTDHQGLNLITCTGNFDPRSHNYDQRVVVYTTLAGS